MLIDTHCHIYSEYYDNINEIMKKIEESKISIIINNACDLKTSYEVLRLSEQYNNMYCTIGLHPNENSNEIEKVVNLLYNNLNNSKMIGIGEIGLDYHYEQVNKEEQIKIFRAQLAFAQQYDLPVIIHSREATMDTLKILKEFKLRGIIHCFNGSYEIAKEYIKMGYKLGINGVVTFKNCKLIEVLKKLSLEDIVFETDSPYLTPEPNRGKKNDPSYINSIVDYLSINLNVSREELIQKTCNNVRNLFRI